MDRKKETLAKLRNSEWIYGLVSACTQMPYVVCDPETYDDEVLLFFREEDAKAKAKSLVDEQQPILITKVEKKFFLAFYTGLYPMGVNCLMVDQGLDSQISIQLSELVTVKKPENLKEGTEIVENPEFHLTALYFLQDIRRKNPPEITQELRELYEEVLAHFYRGTYIAAVGKDKKMPTLSQKDGKIYQPLFTDVQEFFKFQGTQKEVVFQPIVIKAEKIPEILSDQLDGAVINPMGMNLQLHIKKENKTES